MENNLDEAIPVNEIAGHLAISIRQLERLFRRNLKTTPGRYYLQLRLASARRLLTRTNRPISDIAAACGFVSLAHFSSRYHAAFGVSPRGDRQRQMQEARGEQSE